jgi:hypothetical protein
MATSPRAPEGADIKEIYGRFLKGTQAARVRFPEELFKQTYLLFFSGQPNCPTNLTPALWAGIAGSPYAEVDVVDEAGEFLYTVPPLFDRSVLKVAENTRLPGLLNEFIQAENYMKITPALGKGYMAKVLKTYADNAQPGGAPMKHKATWLAIFARYGIFPPGVDPTTVAQAEKPESKITLDYDDDALL